MPDVTDITGIHHVTALCGSAPDNVRFYTKVLGLRLVKKTVNYDDPRAYHFYYGDRLGRPGTLVTFFPHPTLRFGTAGAREVGRTDLAVPVGSLGYWAERLAGAEVKVARDTVDGRDRLLFEDWDGMRFSIRETERPVSADLPASDVDRKHAITGIASVGITVNRMEPTADFLTGTLGFSRVAQRDSRAWFALPGQDQAPALEVVEDPKAGPAQLGLGSVHHVAWRVPDDAARDRVRDAIAGKVAAMTETRDRGYFRSIYFREPGGVIFEIATDVPGFTADEDEASLGTALKLPPQFEPRRAEIEAALPPLEAV